MMKAASTTPFPVTVIQSPKSGLADTGWAKSRSQFLAIRLCSKGDNIFPGCRKRIGKLVVRGHAGFGAVTTCSSAVGKRTITSAVSPPT